MAYDEDLADRLRELLAGRSGVTEKKMFGGLAFLLDGHMAVAAGSRGGLMLRADPAAVDDLLTDPRIEPFEMRGRAMRGWLSVTVDAEVADEELRGWVQQSIDYAEGLPPKR